MKKTSVLCLLLLCLTVNSFAQTAAKSAYVELGGPGLASLNYDMRLQKKEDGLGFRVGVGGFSVKSTYDNGYDKQSVLFVPIGLNYLLGKDEKHYFEFGAGATIVSAKDTYNNGNSTEGDKFNSTFGHLYFGYRVQPKNGGFLFRAGLSPVFGKGYFIPYLPAISFGYKF